MDNLFYRVIPHLDIDSKLKLGITPKKLPSGVISNLESKFPRPQVVYLTTHRKIFNFHLAHFDKYIVIANVDYQGVYGDTAHWFYSEDIEYGVYERAYFFIYPNDIKHWVTDLKLKFVDDIDEGEDTQSTP